MARRLPQHPLWMASLSTGFPCVSSTMDYERSDQEFFEVVRELFPWVWCLRNCAYAELPSIVRLLSILEILRPILLYSSGFFLPATPDVESILLVVLEGLSPWLKEWLTKLLKLWMFSRSIFDLALLMPFYRGVLAISRCVFPVAEVLPILPGPLEAID